MTVRDPFLRAILVVADRTVVFLVLCVIVCTLLWEFLCTRELHMTSIDALRCALALARGESAPFITVAFGLTATVAILVSSILSTGLFVIWRRRARVESSQVRGPLSGRGRV